MFDKNEIIEMAEKVYGHCDWHESALCHLESFAKLVDAKATAKAVEREREACAKLCEPKTSRPCDCDWCDCGNSTSARMVAEWDESANMASAIRARGEA